MRVPLYSLRELSALEQEGTNPKKHRNKASRSSPINRQRSYVINYEQTNQRFTLHTDSQRTHWRILHLRTYLPRLPPLPLSLHSSPSPPRLPGMPGPRGIPPREREREGLHLSSHAATANNACVLPHSSLTTRLG